MTSPTIAPMTERLRLAADYLTDNGWIQREMGSEGEAACLTGAIQFCAPMNGDEHLIRQVLARRDRAEEWNDKRETTADDVIGYLRTAEITDDALADVYGRQWVEVVALVRAITGLTLDQRHALAAAAAAAADADAAYAAYADAAYADAACRRTARGLAVRHLIGMRGFTAEHYRTLTGPWARTIGPVHPDDVKDGLA